MSTKLEAAGSKDNEIPEINVLQKFTSHALCLSPQSHSSSASKLIGTFERLLVEITCNKQASFKRKLFGFFLD